MHDVCLLKWVAPKQISDLEFSLTSRIFNFTVTGFGMSFTMIDKELQGGQTDPILKTTSLEVLVFHGKFLAIPLVKKFNIFPSKKSINVVIEADHIIEAESSDELIAKNVLRKLHNEIALNRIGADDLFQLLETFYCKT